MGLARAMRLPALKHVFVGDTYKRHDVPLYHFPSKATGRKRMLVDLFSPHYHRRRLLRSISRSGILTSRGLTYVPVVPIRYLAFLHRGFLRTLLHITVASNDIAAAAGVSTLTSFSHTPNGSSTFYAEMDGLPTAFCDTGAVSAIPLPIPDGNGNLPGQCLPTHTL